MRLLGREAPRRFVVEIIFAHSERVSSDAGVQEMLSLKESPRFRWWLVDCTIAFC